MTGTKQKLADDMGVIALAIVAACALLTIAACVAAFCCC